MEPLVDAFVARQQQLIAAELDVELAEVEAVQRQSTPSQLQRRGLALRALVPTARRTGLGGKAIVTFELGFGPGTRGDGRLPAHTFRVGDIHAAAKQAAAAAAGSGTSPPPDTDASGVVIRVNDRSLVLAFDEEPDVVTECDTTRRGGGGLRMLKIANRTTYHRMTTAMAALGQFVRHEGAHALVCPPGLVDVLFGRAAPRMGAVPPLDAVAWTDPGLNGFQQTAVARALAAEHLFLIHGPPGTGKTATCTELIRQLVQRGQRVLVCGPSNISVDNVLERLEHRPPRAAAASRAGSSAASVKLGLVRVGHPARVIPVVRQHTLDARLGTSHGGGLVQDLRAEMDGVLAKIQKPKHRAERRDLWREHRTLRKELRVREARAVEEVLAESQVVLCTLSGAATRVLRHSAFDVVIIDEIAQAMEAECWIAIAKAKKVILAGDHCQLPPTIKSDTKAKAKAKAMLRTAPAGDGPPGRDTATERAVQDWASMTLETTLFDRQRRLHKAHLSTLMTRLEIQYRMNEAIMGFSSRQFYDGKLQADASVRDHVLADLPGVARTELTTCPLLYIDTSHAGMDEAREADENDALGTESRLNHGEADVVVARLAALVDAGVAPDQIGIITPYAGQVGVLKDRVLDEFPAVEISTVDGFQGREKEAILLSLVRSNDTGEVGFLSDTRRMNVALTRARRHLCVVANGACIGSRNAFLAQMVEWLEAEAEIEYAS
ncbi:P-loop containing nucleoside triphosphate hydrolase protein [Caulochytrium protostelioides]|uniref:DNA helicase n=1 Tax=Caulochytrium protostelioides TaxID=1555241 RepID=A0A4P9WUW1_9FUNG|nr:P-loop containing nucleoside triphosphate hydrolase protein [Caulochytrium protostelioides]